MTYGVAPGRLLRLIQAESVRAYAPGNPSRYDDTLAGRVVELKCLAGDARAVGHSALQSGVADGLGGIEAGVVRVIVGLQVKGGLGGHAGAVDHDTVAGVAADDVARTRGGPADDGIESRRGDVDPVTEVGQAQRRRH